LPGAQPTALDAVHTHGHGGLQLADGIIDQRALLLKPAKLLLRFFERQPELSRDAPNRIVEVHHLPDLAQRETTLRSSKTSLRRALSR
jgi:hypothetical protein